MEYIETSAKTNTHIKELFDEIKKCQGREIVPDAINDNLVARPGEEKKNDSCSC
jgi:hypothetical protein